MNLKNTQPIAIASDESRAPVQEPIQWSLLRQMEFDFAIGISAKAVSTATITQSVAGESTGHEHAEQAAPQIEGAQSQPSDCDEETAVTKMNETQPPGNDEANNISSNHHVVPASKPYSSATLGIGLLINIKINIVL